MFAKLSGFKVNLQKSELLITSLFVYEVRKLAQIMNCRAAKFSLKYIGLLLCLSDISLSRQCYQSLEDVQSILHGGKKAIYR
jgi:hypothetical protein